MPADTEVIQQAVAQLEQGFAAFALQQNGKKPITAQGFKNATRNPEWLRTQLEAPAAGNYGMIWPEDAADRVLALDLDNGSDGRERPWQDRLVELINRIGPLPTTKATTTPSGGRHAFYRWPHDTPIPSGDELFGFTVRWPGRGYLVGPGSSINGVRYVDGPTPHIADLPPAWVRAALSERKPTYTNGQDGVITIQGAYVLPAEIPAGRRYATVRDYVASRYNSGLSPDELWDLVRTQVAPRFTQPKTEDELRADFGRVMAKITERLGPPRHGGVAIPVGPLEDAPLTEFDSTPVEWLWPAWLPRGVVTLMDGNPGVSKSTLVADLVARITTGREWPDGAAGPTPGRVMWITTEDDPGRVLRPRVEAAGGDASLVRFVMSEVVFPSGAGAFRELVVQRASEPQGLALVVLDPLFSHIDATVRTIADSEMRKGVMNPLQDAAQAAGVAILVVRHYSKDTTASPISRGAGSLGGIVGAARALWSVIPDPSDATGETKAVGVSKLNYAKANPPLRYTVVSRVPPGWITGTVSSIEWIGSSTLSIDELMGDLAHKTADAVETLREILEPGPMGSQEVQGKMQSRGFGKSGLQRAQKLLGIRPRKSGMTGGWVWELPAEDAEDAHRDSSASSSLADARAGRDQSSDSSASSDSSTTGHEDAEDAEGAEESGRPARAPAREAGWARPCLWYDDHRTSHRVTPAGDICLACHPDDAAYLPGGAA